MKGSPPNGRISTTPDTSGSIGGGSSFTGGGGTPLSNDAVDRSSEEPFVARSTATSIGGEGESGIPPASGDGAPAGSGYPGSDGGDDSGDDGGGGSQSGDTLRDTQSRAKPSRTRKVAGVSTQTETERQSVRTLPAFDAEKAEPKTRQTAASKISTDLASLENSIAILGLGLLKLASQQEHPALRPIYDFKVEELAVITKPGARLVKKHLGKYAKVIEGSTDGLALIYGLYTISNAIGESKKEILNELIEHAKQGDVEAIKILSYYANKGGARKSNNRTGDQQGEHPASRLGREDETVL